MKILKKFLCCTIILSVLLTGNVFAYTMYATDGRSIEVNYEDAQVWRDVNWYDEPVQIMYAPDGRTIVVAKTQVAAWENVGWYTYPVNTAYVPAPDYKNEYAYTLKQKLKTDSYSSELSFSLVYINEDNIPELIYRNSECHAAGAEVFTFVNGEVVSLGIFGEFGDIYYIPFANRFTSQYWGMGWEYISLYEISGRYATNLVNFEAGYDPLPGQKAEYIVNDTKVSYSDYMKTRKSYSLPEEPPSLGTMYYRTMNVNKYRLTDYSIYKVFGW